MADHDHEHCDDPTHDHGSQGEGPSVTAVLEPLGPCKKLLRVEIPAGDVRSEIETRLDKLRTQVHLKGFRKGKAPRARIEKLYGESVRDDARDHLIRQGYAKALETQLGIDKVLMDPTIEKVDFSVESGLKFEVTVHTRPEFELPAYQGLEVTVGKVEVSDEDIQTQLDGYRRSRGEQRPVEGDDAVVEAEDVVTVDVEVWLADEFESFSQAQEAGQQTEVKPLRTETGLEVHLHADQVGQYEVEDLADSLQGLKIGEWGDTETDLPQDFEVVEGRGEPAVLRMQVKGIKRTFLPELTDAWVKEGGQFETVEDLRREVREGLQQRQEVVRRHNVEEKVIGKLLEAAGAFDLPQDLLEAEIESAKRRRVFELRFQQGRTEDNAQAEVEENAAEIRRDVERNLRTFFVLDEIARREGIRVSDRDVDARITRLAMARGRDPRDVREELERHSVMNQLRQDLLDEKVRTFLREHAKVTESEDL